jgi:hypothetical protein
VGIRAPGEDTLQLKASTVARSGAGGHGDQVLE